MQYMSFMSVKKNNSSGERNDKFSMDMATEIKQCHEKKKTNLCH